MSSLIAQFLKAREMIDMDARNTITGPKGKDKPNVMERPRADPGRETVRTIIEARPSKKKVMEFLKMKVAQYTDASSSDDD
jgi:hypothetical protein